MTTHGMAGLPPLYAAWMGELLGAGIPDETRADCASCSMCVDAAGAGAPRFHPESKCCTFFPDLPNFLAGRILADDDPAMDFGRAAILERIASRVAVTPLAVARPRSWWVLYNDGFPDLFGRARTLRCPYYVEDGGKCGVWRHRDAICSTFFCKHERGQVGLTFWRALSNLLAAVERNLAWWCLAEADLDVGTLSRLQASQQLGGGARLQAAELEGRDPHGYRELWGPWHGRERELYLECAARVGRLSWNDVAAICHPEVGIMAAVARKCHARLRDDGVPERVAAGSFQVVAISGGRVSLKTYRDYDPIEVPAHIFQALPGFDGRASADLGLDAAELRRLVDFGVLREVS
jgi:hypothetical protein